MEHAEIDIHPYLAEIVRRWYWIILGVLLTALPAAALLLLQPPTYSATSSVLMLIRQTGSQIGLNQPLVSVETIDVGARRQGLLALSRNTAVESRLPQDVIDRIALANYRPGMFIQQNLIQVRADGDLINISAEATSPEQAKLLADAWATTYVEYVGTLYNDDHSQIQLASQAVLPFEPNGPQVVRNTLIAAVLGALVSLFVIIIQTFFATQRAQPSRPPREQPAHYPATSP